MSGESVTMESKDASLVTSEGTGVVLKDTPLVVAKDRNGTNGTHSTPHADDADKKPDDETEKQKEAPLDAPTSEAAPVDASDAPVTSTPASAKSKARRQSSGVPEHKSKRSAKKGTKSSNSHPDAKPGDYFFIKLKGYPLWPGVVCSEDMLPTTLLTSRPVTAARADGTYRQDYEDGGKKVNDRTFPVMYLFTQEFSWIPNYDLVDINLEDAGVAADKIKNQQLASAHRLAAENHDLQHWKTVLIEFKEAVEEEIAAKAAAAAAKAEAKAASKAKRKSKSAVDADDDDAADVSMADAPDADGEGTEKKPKSSKKRKATGDAEDVETPARSESVKKLKFKPVKSAPETPNGATPKSTKKDQSATKSAKSKSKKVASAEAAEPKEPEQTPQEKLAKKEKEIMFLRHKLQKGLLSRDGQPKEEEMKQMSDYITKLEEHLSLEVSIMRATKINKVLKAILKLDTIPKEEEFKFKDRSQALLDAWNKILNADSTNGGSSTPAANVPEKELTNGSSAKTEEKTAKAETKTEEAKPEGGPVKESAPSEPSEKKVDQDGDVAMASADEPKSSGAIEASA